MTRAKDRRQTRSKVNTAPRGLQAFLGNVNQGVNPHELDHLVKPTIRLEPFYQLDSLRYETQAGAGTPHTQPTVDITVPNDQVWLVKFASFTILGATGGRYDVGIGVLSDAATSMVQLESVEGFNALPNNGPFQIGHDFGDGFLMPPGWRIRGQVNSSNDTTSRTIYTSCIYVPFVA